MNSLDEEVKKFDPAWPLVQKFNPKYKATGDKKAESVTEDNSAKSSPDSTTPSVNRDPRMFKIIKSEKDIDRKRPITDDDLFTIDREGEEHVKKLLNKKPRVDPKPAKEYLQNGLFGSKDLDLRIPPSDKPMKTEDSDMRNSQSKNWTSEDVFKMLIKKDKKPPAEFPDAAASQAPPPLSTSAAAAAAANLKIPTPTPIPQPREPTWKVKIDGFPQMPEIGTDPRLLSRCPFYDASRTITIDGTKYNLHLDRVQPCIFVNNELHAVRFYCQNIELNIDNVPFEISANGLAHIKINRRFYIATLGGPGHELIINGWPYNVRIDGNMHQISVSGYPVSVQFMVQRPIQVNVHNAIPPYICEWAVKGFFGAAQYLNIPPLNPLKNQKLQDVHSFQFRNELASAYERRSVHNIIIQQQHQQQQQQQQSEPVVVQKPAANIIPQNPIDVHDLFQKLVATGIILPNKSNELKLDITKYSWDNYKISNEKEISELYSGHQCDLCGTRFKNKDSKEFELHLDYHFYKNTTSLTSTRKGRNYVAGSRQWVLGGTIRAAEPDFSFEQTTNCEQKFKCPMFEDAEMNVGRFCVRDVATR